MDSIRRSACTSWRPREITISTHPQQLPHPHPACNAWVAPTSVEEPPILKECLRGTSRSARRGRERKNFVWWHGSAHIALWLPSNIHLQYVCKHTRSQSSLVPPGSECFHQLTNQVVDKLLWLDLQSYHYHSHMSSEKRTRKNSF